MCANKFDGFFGRINENGDVIATVRENTNLDRWDGNNWNCGSNGNHKGLTKLKDGRYVLIHTTQWIGGEDSAEIISPEQAVKEIFESRNEYVLFNKYKELDELADKMLSEEDRH